MCLTLRSHPKSRPRDLGLFRPVALSPESKSFSERDRKGDVWGQTINRNRWSIQLVQSNFHIIPHCPPPRFTDVQVLPASSASPTHLNSLYLTLLRRLWMLVSVCLCWWRSSVVTYTCWVLLVVFSVSSLFNFLPLTAWKATAPKKLCIWHARDTQSSILQQFF